MVGFKVISLRVYTRLPTSLPWRQQHPWKSSSERPFSSLVTALWISSIDAKLLPSIGVSDVSQIGPTFPFNIFTRFGNWWASRPCVIIHIHSASPNLLAHSNARNLDIVSSLYTSFNLLKMSVPLSFRFTKNLMILCYINLSFVFGTRLQHLWFLTKLQNSYKTQPIDYNG